MPSTLNASVNVIQSGIKNKPLCKHDKINAETFFPML